MIITLFPFRTPFKFWPDNKQSIDTPLHHKLPPSMSTVTSPSSPVRNKLNPRDVCWSQTLFGNGPSCQTPPSVLARGSGEDTECSEARQDIITSITRISYDQMVKTQLDTTVNETLKLRLPLEKRLSQTIPKSMKTLGLNYQSRPIF